MQWSDVKWLLTVLAMAILFTIFVLPYFSRFGYGLWTAPVYIAFFVAFLYGRCNRLPKHPPRHARHVR